MISVIIPTLNEEDGISHVIKGIPRKIKGEKVEVIIVDGRSTDFTIEKAKSADPRVRIVIEKRKGKGVAMQTGVKHARGNKIVFIDGDGEYNPKYIPYMISLLSKCNMVRGYRDLTKGYRALKNREMSILVKLVNLVSPLSYPIFKDLKNKDPLTGLRAFRKKDWKKLNIKSKNFAIEAEIEIKAIKNDFKIIEFPILYKKRMGGRSKFVTSFKDIIEIHRYIRKHRSILKNKPRNIMTIKEHRYSNS